VDFVERPTVEITGTEMKVTAKITGNGTVYFLFDKAE
jgi:hypothetical protein